MFHIYIGLTHQIFSHVQTYLVRRADYTDRCVADPFIMEQMSTQMDERIVLTGRYY